MTLVERFIEINQWPTSRKTALLSGAILVFQIPIVSVQFFTFSQYSWFNLHLFNWILWPWVGSLVVTCAISSFVAWKGSEGKWTVWLLIVPYGIFTLALIGAAGVVTTSLFSLYPIVVFTVTLWYGPRVAWPCFFYGIFLWLSFLTLQHWLDWPVAPLFLDHNLDVQQSAWHVAGNLFTVLTIFLGCLALVVMVVAARHVQDRRLDRAARLIRRYVPSQVADAIMSGRNESVNAHTRRKLTIFFSDLVGFTDIAEQMEPEDLSQVLNEYFSEMTAIAHQYDGTVDELTGDAILIFFGAPQVTDDKDQALRAVRMAIDMLAAVERLNAKWRSSGIDVVFKVRMGINTGVATVGNFGSEGRTKYAALGRNVNLAARLQAQSEPGRILICHPTWLLVQDQIPCNLKGELQLKGITKPVTVYEVSEAAS